MFKFTFFSILVWLAGTNAHLSAFHKGMYCINGTQKGVVNQNANAMVNPLYNLTKEEWWFQKYNGCSDIPPAKGDILDIPAGKSFPVEIANNQAFTTLSYGGKFVSEWTDGGNRSTLGDGIDCITSPNMHTKNQSSVAGTAFAISYVSEISDVTMDNLVVFSVNQSTPWKRVTYYDVPANMPPCPNGGNCICAWLWVPNGCGEPNMYMQGYNCKVTNSTSIIPLAKPNAPKWCEDAPKNCTQGAKQIIAWNQESGNNIEVSGFDKSGNNKSPGYNIKCGFKDGAQDDIFAEPIKKSSGKRSVDGDEDTNIAKKSVNLPDLYAHRRSPASFRRTAKNQILH